MELLFAAEGQMDIYIFIGRNHSRQHGREKADKTGQPRHNCLREVRNPGPGS
jgi:hypothetical protein